MKLTFMAKRLIVHHQGIYQRVRWAEDTTPHSVLVPDHHCGQMVDKKQPEKVRVDCLTV